MFVLKKIAYTLVLIGAFNWGLIGVFNFDIVARLFGGFPMIVSIVYLFIGLSSIYLVIGMCAGRNKNCSCNGDVCSCDIKITKSEKSVESEEETQN